MTQNEPQKYRLKPRQESFEVVDGPFEGRKFEKDKVYTEIPPQEKHRFERVPERKVRAAPEEKTLKASPQPAEKAPAKAPEKAPEQDKGGKKS